jgi:hypothetical protein
MMAVQWNVRFKYLSAIATRITALCDVTSYSVIEILYCFGGTCCLSESGGSRLFLNVGELTCI